MANNIPVTPGSGAVVAAEEIGGVYFQLIKLMIGQDGYADFLEFGQKPMSASLPVVIAANQTSIPVDPVTIAGNTTPLTVAPVTITGNTDPLTVAPVVIASNSAPLTINQITNGYDPVASFNRPANTNAYAAGDVVGGVLTFASSGPGAQSIMILGTQFEVDRADIPAGSAGYRLHLYSATPPSALADNAPWDLPSGDRAAYLGFVELGALEDLGSTLYVEQNNQNKQVRLASSTLYAYLVTKAAYTPAASTPHKLTLHNVAV